MGHVNSSQGNPDRCVSQAESGLDLKTNGNIVHNEVNMGKCPPMLEVMSKFSSRTFDIQIVMKIIEKLFNSI